MHKGFGKVAQNRGSEGGASAVNKFFTVFTSKNTHLSTLLLKNDVPYLQLVQSLIDSTKTF